MSDRDLIHLFLEATEGANSPLTFRLWSAISLIAGALERRVWLKNGDNIAFPNLYILLVAPPGVGKSIVDEVREIWEQATEPSGRPAFHVAPESMTKAALIDSIKESEKTFLTPKGAPYKYHYLSIAAEEFSVLLSSYDTETVAILNRLWGHPETFSEKRRFGPNKDILFEKPQLNLLGGVQPAYLASLLPEDTWSSGFGRRVLMVYSVDTPHRSLFYEAPNTSERKKSLMGELSQLSRLYGPCMWTEGAMQEIDEWYMSGPPNLGGNPVPAHTNLQSYNHSRGVTALKLIIIASVARSREMVIRKDDVDRALSWMIEAETAMPDIFRAMMGKSDKDLIGEIHLFITQKAVQNKTGKVDGGTLRRFILERAPHEKIPTLIAAAEGAGIIARVGGTGGQGAESELWIPKARTGDWGME